MAIQRLQRMADCSVPGILRMQATLLVYTGAFLSCMQLS